MKTGNFPTKDERLAQCDVDVFTLAQDAVTLAMAVINNQLAYTRAIQILYKYADWRKIELDGLTKRLLQAMEAKEEGQE